MTDSLFKEYHYINNLNNLIIWLLIVGFITFHKILTHYFLKYYSTAWRGGINIILYTFYLLIIYTNASIYDKEINNILEIMAIRDSLLLELLRSWNHCNFTFCIMDNIDLNDEYKLEILNNDYKIKSLIKKHNLFY
jgi:hypothetical protein